MIFKHSIKSIIRTSNKTIIFLFLLIVLTILLNIGAGMYESARNMLLDADETFTSVVDLEYLEDSDGDKAELYKRMNAELEDFNLKKLEKHSAVKAVELEKKAWAYIDEKIIRRDSMPFSNYAIVKISNLIKYNDGLYMGIVDEKIFGSRVRENAYMMINDLDENGLPMHYDFNRDHEYLVAGRIDNEKSPTLILSPGVPEAVEDIPHLIDLTENPNFLQSDEGKQMFTLQEALEVVDNSIQVTTVTAFAAYEPYYYNELPVKDGRIFNTLEYQQHKNVIIITEALADFYEVEIGETLYLKLHYNKSGMGVSDFLSDSEFDYEANFEVIGILENKEDYKHTIYMPEPDWIEQDFHSKTIARYIVKNGAGTKFMEDNKNNILPNMHFTLYDQGYEESMKPILGLKNNATMILVLGGLSSFAILILFSYLYVIKQKETLKTMLLLGSGKKRTMNYILYGSVTLVLFASLIGSAISYTVLNKVTLMLLEVIKNSYGTDLRYSERAIGVQIPYVPHVRINPWLPFVLMIIILIVAFILLYSFTYSIIKEDIQVSNRNVDKKEKIVLPRKTKVMFTGIRPISLKFALTSLRRSPGRSFIVPVISFILAFFIIFLELLSSMQLKKLDSVYDRIPVNAYLTSLRNETRELGGLDLQYDIYKLIDSEYSYRMKWDLEMYNNYMIHEEYTSSQAEEERKNLIAGSDFFDEMNLYTGTHYEYMGIAKTKEGVENETISQVPKKRVHNSAYGYDWFLNKINKMPKLGYADDIRFTPDFFKQPEPEMEFLEGYDYDSLTLRESIAFISHNFAVGQDIYIGDTIRLTSWINTTTEAICSVIDVKVVGIYNMNWPTETIYIPWIMSYDNNYYLDFNFPIDGVTSENNEVWNESLPRNVRAVTFTLKNTERMSDFKDYLESKGFSQTDQIRGKRRVMIIEDKRLVETEQNLRNHIRLIDTIKPIMLILFGVIGFVISYLLIKHRINEMAIMRSMGAKKRQVFFSFLLEQSILFFIGLIPIAIYSLFFLNQIALYGAAIVYLIICYLMGTAFALTIINRAKILNILFTKE